MTSKHDAAWNKVFEELQLLDAINANGHVLISATTRKEIGGREPRLMAKQDTLESRPGIFRRNHLVILPTKNGEYIIFRDMHHRSYFEFDLDAGTISVGPHASTPHIDAIETLDLSTNTREFQAIDFAHIVSTLKIYTNEPDLFLTISLPLHVFAEAGGDQRAILQPESAIGDLKIVPTNLFSPVPGTQAQWGHHSSLMPCCALLIIDVKRYLRRYLYQYLLHQYKIQNRNPEFLL
jgi:hypothetical protein